VEGRGGEKSFGWDPSSRKGCTMTSCRGGEVHTTGVMATPRKTQRKAPASERGRYNCGTQAEACVTSRGRCDTRRFSDGYGKCAAGFAVYLELKADY
jgi:hypothetical protein